MNQIALSAPSEQFEDENESTQNFGQVESFDSGGLVTSEYVNNATKVEAQVQRDDQR